MKSFKGQCVWIFNFHGLKLCSSVKIDRSKNIKKKVFSASFIINLILKWLVSYLRVFVPIDKTTCFPKKAFVLTGLFLLTVTVLPVGTVFKKN